MTGEKKKEKKTFRVSSPNSTRGVWVLAFLALHARKRGTHIK